MQNFKYFLFLAVFLFSGLASYAQTRKNISQFSHFQSYFNPSLTGYEGSTVRGFVRNQWSGFEGAPKTFFFSTEIDFGEIAGEVDPALMGKNAISVNLLHDTYGAFRDNELMVSYASRVRLTENHNLRLGVGVNYQTVRLDGNAMTTEEQNDPTLGQYYGAFSDMQFLDANVGIADTSAVLFFVCSTPHQRRRSKPWGQLHGSLPGRAVYSGRLQGGDHSQLVHHHQCLFQKQEGSAKCN